MMSMAAMAKMARVKMKKMTLGSRLKAGSNKLKTVSMPTKSTSSVNPRSRRCSKDRWRTKRLLNPPKSKRGKNRTRHPKSKFHGERKTRHRNNNLRSNLAYHQVQKIWTRKSSNSFSFNNKHSRQKWQKSRKLNRREPGRRQRNLLQRMASSFSSNKTTRVQKWQQVPLLLVVNLSGEDPQSASQSVADQRKRRRRRFNMRKSSLSKYRFSTLSTSTAWTKSSSPS